MLEAIEQTSLVVNMTVVPERRGRGRKGYGHRLTIRLLVYTQLKGIHKDESLEKYPRENRGFAIALGLDGIPDRTTVGRWKKRLEPIVRRAFEKISRTIKILLPTDDLIVDSAPLEDSNDPEAKWGHYSRGPFKGFKVHTSVDQLGILRKATITPGNRPDSPFLPELITNLTLNRVLADAGYDSKDNRKPCRENGRRPTSPRIRGTLEIQTPRNPEEEKIHNREIQFQVQRKSN